LSKKKIIYNYSTDHRMF